VLKAIRHPYDCIVAGLRTRIHKGFQGKLNALECVDRISFSESFESESYRMNLAMQMGLEATDDGMNTAPNFGGGSSFKNMKHVKKAS
jgi:hypothetical protein